MGVDSCVSERALREIYLRGFEIAVKEGNPVSIMTSYNLINGIHAANSKDLCMTVARKKNGDLTEQLCQTGTQQFRKMEAFHGNVWQQAMTLSCLEIRMMIRIFARHIKRR